MLTLRIWNNWKQLVHCPQIKIFCFDVWTQKNIGAQPKSLWFEFWGSLPLIFDGGAFIFIMLAPVLFLSCSSKISPSCPMRRNCFLVNEILLHTRHAIELKIKYSSSCLLLRISTYIGRWGLISSQPIRIVIMFAQYKNQLCVEFLKRIPMEIDDSFSVMQLSWQNAYYFFYTKYYTCIQICTL